ncbi:MAG: hypothetical protein KAT39_03930, partial [Alphaproteobacteria bacterium]|nr:hypothetical protein [Alphaproteobacteria bacterium]
VTRSSQSSHLQKNHMNMRINAAFAKYVVVDDRKEQKCDSTFTKIAGIMVNMRSSVEVIA